MARRTGAGGLYFVRSQRLWRAVLDLPAHADGRRHQWSASSRDRAVAEARLNAKRTELIEAGSMPDRDIQKPALTRREMMINAKRRGTHTRAEWIALLRRTPSICRYCKTPLIYLNRVTDHAQSIARGGSDTIDNLQIICWECNAEKGDIHGDDFAYRGELPRPYRPLPANRGVDSVLAPVN